MATPTRTVDREVTGTPAEVAALLSHYTTYGELVAMTAPVPVAGGRVALTLRTRATTVIRPAAVPRRRVCRRTVLIVAGVLVALALLGAAGWALYAAWLWVAAHAALLLGVAVVALLLFGLLARLFADGGRHCPGC